jgi:hypothetical protein
MLKYAKKEIDIYERTPAPQFDEAVVYCVYSLINEFEKLDLSGSAANCVSYSMQSISELEATDIAIDELATAIPDQADYELIQLAKQIPPELSIDQKRQALDLFSKLSSFQILSPLTGEESEWVDVAAPDGHILYQNNRDGRVFKCNGETWFLDGRIFVEKNGSSFTSSDSRVFIDSFPYTPVSEYVYI